MAKRKDYDLNNYSKYTKHKQGFSRGARDFFKLWGLSNIANNQSEAKRKQRRRELDRKLKESDKKLIDSCKKSGAITVNNIIISIIFFVVLCSLGVVFIDSIFENGLIDTLKGTLLVGIIILIIAFIICYIFINKNKAIKKGKLSENEVEELQRQLENIEVYKNIVNNSTDVCAVKSAMDELIEIIDFILEYEEETLHEVGMTKQKLPEQKQFILDNYDLILKQVSEGNEL